MITDWREFNEMCRLAHSDEEILALVTYLTSNGYSELQAREMVQVQLAVVAGETPGP